jgi:hypothetical protein
MLKPILTLAIGCTAFSAQAQECLQSWRHGDGRLLTIHQGFASGEEGRGFFGTIGVQSYVVVKQGRTTTAFSYGSAAEIPDNEPWQQDQQALPPARADQTLTVDEGPLAGRWTGDGCQAL